MWVETRNAKFFTFYDHIPNGYLYCQIWVLSYLKHTHTTQNKQTKPPSRDRLAKEGKEISKLGDAE